MGGDCGGADRLCLAPAWCPGPNWTLGCAVAGGWSRGSEGGASPSQPPPTECGPAEMLGSVSRGIQF
ncbi:hypothetical protein NQZ68_039216 [Dissostichus eleginoides]|nr:hypothetical protein NQZ68_039216 [Dissostichus eleginoides]